MTQQEFKRRFETNNYSIGMACSSLRTMYNEGATADIATNCGMRYAVVREPSSVYIPRQVLGYADTFAGAQVIMRKVRDEEMNDPIYRKTVLKYDRADFCKIQTFRRAPDGRTRTYDISIVDIPYVLKQCESKSSGEYIEYTKREDRERNA